MSKEPDDEARRGRIPIMGLRPRSNEASRLFARKPSGRQVFWLCAALARSLQPTMGMLLSRRLAHNKYPLPQHPLEFSERLFALLAAIWAGEGDFVGYIISGWLMLGYWLLVAGYWILRDHWNYLHGRISSPVVSVRAALTSPDRRVSSRNPCKKDYAFQRLFLSWSQTFRFPK